MNFGKNKSLNSSKDVLLKDNAVNKKIANSLKIDRVIPEKVFKLELIWINIAYMGAVHLAAVYGLYLAFTSAKLATNLFAVFMFEFSAIGITAGAHRLWAHRAYKAKWQLKILLAFMATTVFEGHVIAWARDHRVHHKHTDTMADPYSAGRGFFYSHIGWLFVRKHPSVAEKGQKIDMSDLYECPILAFQKKYYWPLVVICGWTLPTLIPFLCWDEFLFTALAVPANLRLILMLHNTFLVNSVAHFYGYKPYDSNMRPTNNLFVAISAAGEGWHNYHHTFPWDYKASELSDYSVNFTNAFIDFFAWVGWAYDLKTVNPDVIQKRVMRTGDGSHELWGWGDKDATKEDREGTIVSHRNNLN